MLEYKWFDCTSDDPNKIVDAMNSHGRYGWKTISIQRIEYDELHSHYILYLERYKE